VKVFPASPFRLQLGGNFGAALYPLVAELSLKHAVQSLGSEEFSFDTTATNPSIAILADVYKSLNPQDLEGSAYENFFGKFRTELFSLGGKDAGAHFHVHGSTWLYLTSGVKEWAIQRFDTPLSKNHYWDNPASFFKECESSSNTSSVSLSDLNDSQAAAPQNIQEKDPFFRRWTDIDGRKLATCQWLESEDTYHVIQKAGQVLLLPAMWLHATRNLHPFTLGFAKQDHTELDAKWNPDWMAEYTRVYSSDPWRAAEISRRNLVHQPGDIAERIRLILCLCRSNQLDEAEVAIFNELLNDLTKACEANVLARHEVLYFFHRVMPMQLEIVKNMIRDYDLASNGKLGDTPPPNWIRLDEWQKRLHQIDLANPHEATGQQMNNAVKIPGTSGFANAVETGKVRDLRSSINKFNMFV
jgi:hypothetical protein